MDLEKNTVTSFTVEPLGGSVSRVTIATEMPTRGGFHGWIEKVVTGSFLRRVYAAELAQLDSEVRSDAR